MSASAPYMSKRACQKSRQPITEPAHWWTKGSALAPRREGCQFKPSCQLAARGQAANEVVVVSIEVSDWFASCCCF